jgi:hypothetical protein
MDASRDAQTIIDLTDKTCIAVKCPRPNDIVIKEVYARCDLVVVQRNHDGSSREIAARNVPPIVIFEYEMIDLDYKIGSSSRIAPVSIVIRALDALK